MESKTWLAILLCCLVWLSYEMWLNPKKNNVDVTQSINKTQSVDPANDASSLETKSSIRQQFNDTYKSPKNSLESAIHTFVQVTKEANQHKGISQQELIYESPVAIYTFSPIGGALLSVKLKTYKQSLHKNSDNITLVGGENDFSLSGHEVFTDEAFINFNTAAYKVTHEEGKIEFTLNSAQDYVIKKTYTLLKNAPYFLGFHLTLERKNKSKEDTQSLQRKESLGYVYFPLGQKNLEFSAEDPLKAYEVVSYQNEKVIRKATNKLDKREEVFMGATGWVGFGNKYFLSSWINLSDINPDVMYMNWNQNISQQGEGWIGAALRFPVVFRNAKNFDLQLQCYAGPKDHRFMVSSPTLKQTIDYGFFSKIAYPLLELLSFFNRFFHNYGLSIIFLTLAIRIAFFPLTHKSTKQMKKMQELQPQIAQLKIKYKDDNMAFAREQMSLFKAHKVHPLGGCLPVLIQIPVLMALYSLLGNAVELYHAPFFGWIHDLSAKDPFYVFPALMGLSLFVQQKITPNAGMDPLQQKILMFGLPAIFTFTMINFPSGLNFYLFFSTFLGILQQVLVRGRTDKDKKDKMGNKIIPSDQVTPNAIDVTPH